MGSYKPKTVLGLLANGVTQQEILKEYPSLTEESIRVALEFAQTAVKNEIIIDVQHHRSSV